MKKAYIKSYIEDIVSIYLPNYYIDSGAIYIMTRFLIILCEICFNQIKIIMDYKKNNICNINILKCIFSNMFESRSFNDSIEVLSIKQQPIFPVAYFNFLIGKSLNNESLLFLTHVMQYICVECLEIASIYTKQYKRATITSLDISMCLQSDKLYSKLIKKYKIEFVNKINNRSNKEVHLFLNEYLLTKGEFFCERKISKILQYIVENRKKN
jgi:hypothetical protein